MSVRKTRREILGLTLAVAGWTVLGACAPAATPTAPPAAPTATPAPAAAAPTATTAPAAATTAPAAKPTVAPTAAPTVAPTAAAKPTAAAAAKGTIRFTHWWGDQFAQYIPTMTQKTGITVQEERSPYSGYFQKLLTQLVGGVAPDIMLIDANENGDFFTSGTLAPFDDYVKAAKIDMSKFNVDQAKENGYKGQTMGLSLFTMQDLIMHVNYDLADKQGLLNELPTWGKPNYDKWTWDDFIAWAKKATKQNSDGTFEQYGLGTAFGGWWDWQRAVIYQNGAQLFDDEWNYAETKVLCDSDPFIQAMQLQYDLTFKHKVAPTPDAEGAVQGGSYRAKRAVAAINWSTPSAWPEENTFKQIHFHMPFFKSKIHAFGANYISVNKASKVTDLGFQWVTTFCVDTDVRTKFLQVSSVPAYDPLPIVQAAPEGTAKTIGLINLSRIKGMSTIPANTEGVVQYPRWYGYKAPGFTRDTLSTAVQQLMGGKVSAKDAFTQAKQKIDAELAKKK